MTAEPEPAFSRGSEDMIMTVAGGMTCAMAVPMRKNATSSTQMGVCCPSGMKPRKDTEVSVMPPTHTARAPKRSTSSRARGAKII